ncbi:DUF3576 domain-containing protein [Skermanella sp. TT6]|uniref:DUF3576 domain-containing protein n=2 Tax=Skermanella cutis TaxID=2775420 RepID=A0ABX7BDZ1_9PROT|nr:DUF3576 domain-containing protein [Skermanella sp. TT6]
MARFPLSTARTRNIPGAPTRRKSAAALLGVLGATLLLSGCGGVQPEAKFPDPDEDKRYRYGSLLGGEGGFTLLGPRRAESGPQDGQGIGVNSYLWRASLDTLAFMPIASADPFGGVILTDWYSPPETPNERFKVNLYILDRQLRADGVRVSVFRQQRAGTGPNGGEWRDSGVSTETASRLEDTILTRARQIRIAQTADSR